jgi:exodeoxyribonuclease V alpha subunit
MDQSELKGIIDRFLFQNNENGYAVFALKIDDKTSITVRGYLANVHPGQEVVLQGAWNTHPKFGKQFEAKSYSTQVPSSIMGLKAYLGSGLIKGIGPSYAQKLVDHFGSSVLEVIDKHPHRLNEVEGIGPKRVEQITFAWKDQKEISKVMVYLQDKGISTAYATKIYKAYGQNSVAVITENPYRLADEIWGVGFKMADQIAQAVGIPANSIKRVKAGLLFAISTQTSQGHLYTELVALKQQTLELLCLEQEDTELLLKNALRDLYNEAKIKLVSDNNQHFITLSHHYFAEKGTAQKIEQLLQQPIQHTVDSNAVYQTLRATADNEISLNEDQQRGILACLQNKVTIITGGPGTGKTTLIKKLLSILDEHRLVYKLAAPTGRAAKRITEGTGKFALTIHRLLEFDVASRNFTKNEQNAIQTDYIIIDEASMIDIFLAHAILKGTPFNGHLVFIGDIDQLPSVGAGNFLNDLIASNKVTTIRLTQIFRQAQDSMIVVNAHKVNQGEFPVSSLPDAQPSPIGSGGQAKKDFIYIKENDPALVNQHLQQIFESQLKRNAIFPSDAMVLVPMNRGIVGTQQINLHLQSLLNPIRNDTKQLAHGLYRYSTGDRVMQIRNNYDKNVFNGDTGTIDDINITDKIITVRFYDRLVEYEYSDLDELVLAYAISIHKSQGSEYPAVIIPIFMQHFTLLQRNLIYTAITRAKKLCILIGQPKAIAMAIKNNKSFDRITFLQKYLTSDLKAR